MKTIEQKLKAAEWMRLYRARNLDKVRACDRASKLRNREKILARKAIYRKEKADSILAYNREYQRTNPKSLIWRKRWAKEHPEVYRMSRAARRAREINAMPSWVNKEAIKAIYTEREFLVRETGIQYHVDHIEPLAGKNVCGLHVPWNLQIITAQENTRKSNKQLWGP